MYYWMIYFDLNLWMLNTTDHESSKIVNKIFYTMLHLQFLNCSQSETAYGYNTDSLVYLGMQGFGGNLI